MKKNICTISAASAISMLFVAVILLAGCAHQTEMIDRESKIPPDAAKMMPETDIHPPVLKSDEYETPVPLSAAINTAGAEDSPFVMPNGNTLYFFFTPDVRIPAEKQLLDGVTGIYVSHKVNGEWQKAERVVLQKKGKLSLDGCEFVSGDTMWFCSAREGYTGVNLFTATYNAEKWQDFTYAGDVLKGYETGEMHITADGKELYFHSARAGGKGQLDIWMTRNVDGEWQTPENVEIANSAEPEGWPFISQDGKELWFLRMHGAPDIYRSKKADGRWAEPELIVSTFAGEPTLDNAGNLYFVHHFYNKDDKMIEADIYFAKKKD